MASKFGLGRGLADLNVARGPMPDEMSERELRGELDQLLLDDFYRNRMFKEYDEMVIGPLGEPGASEHAAAKMLELLRKKG